MNQQQLKLRFFGSHSPSELDLRWWTNTGNPNCPFHGCDGNEDAVRYLCGVAFDALADQHHDCGGSLVLAGPPPVAQDLTRRFADLVKLPLIEIRPWAVQSLNDVLVEIAKVLEETWVDDPVLGRINIEIVPDSNSIEVPPCIVFLEDFDSFPAHVVHGLLAMMNHPGRIMPTERGWIVDASGICWIVAASDGIQLSDAIRLFEIEETVAV